jgi:hypothetical protein
MLCQTLRIPHFLDNRLTDGSDNLTAICVSEVIRPTVLYPQKDSCYLFLLETGSTQGT